LYLAAAARRKQLMPTRIHFFRPAAAGLALSLNLVILLGVLLAGCEQVPESIRERVPGGGAAQPRVQVFQADPKATFAAAKAALDQMGYKFTGGGPAQGRMEAMSEISPGDWPGSSHQFSLHADFRPAPDGPGTQVTVRMTEVIEADSTNHPGQGTENALTDTPLVDVFFHAIQQNLAPQKP
jgi:hypothetical protein